MNNTRDKRNYNIISSRSIPPQLREKGISLERAIVNNTRDKRNYNIISSRSIPPQLRKTGKNLRWAIDKLDGFVVRFIAR